MKDELTIGSTGQQQCDVMNIEESLRFVIKSHRPGGKNILSLAGLVSYVDETSCSCPPPRHAFVHS